jgi:YhcH/YjgK/YiaL family protein
MVTDRLALAQLYRSLSPRIASAIDYVTATDFAAMPDGRHDIDGDRLFALVQRYTSKPLAEGRWEAHRKHIDLQLVVSGVERIGYVSIDQLTAEPYDEEKDLTWLSGSGGQWITVPAGHFMLLWPGDAHMPGVQVESSSDVIKVVVKIKVGS